MKKLELFKSAFILAFLLFTTGVVLPWVISSVIFPVWMIIFTVIGIALLWAVILESPYRKLVKWIIKMTNKEDNHDGNGQV